MFKLFIWVLQPDKVTHTAQRKTKVTKIEPLKFGPIEIVLAVNWNPFLMSVATAIQAPAVKAKLSKKDATHYFEDEATCAPAVNCVADKILGIPSGSGADEDVLSDDSRPMQKKAHFDDELEELVEEIQNMYPARTCKLHLDLHSGKATKEEALMGPNLFKPRRALKKPIAGNTKSVPVAPVQAPAELAPPQGP
ncbi:hypothetical protein B0H10DRAFT_1948844 [Mycena sp. CBHHK59/15]|nr:hypothetical protein B0H10DRAFT_1948844 [Mycena sp. CBHHK59/15]